MRRSLWSFSPVQMSTSAPVIAFTSCSRWAARDAASPAPPTPLARPRSLSRSATSGSLVDVRAQVDHALAVEVLGADLVHVAQPAPRVDAERRQVDRRRAGRRIALDEAVEGRVLQRERAPGDGQPALAAGRDRAERDAAVLGAEAEVEVERRLPAARGCPERPLERDLQRRRQPRDARRRRRSTASAELAAARPAACGRRCPAAAWPCPGPSRRRRRRRARRRATPSRSSENEALSARSMGPGARRPAPARARDRSIAERAPVAGCRPGPGAPVAASGRRLGVECRDRPRPRRARRRARRARPVPAAAGPAPPASRRSAAPARAAARGRATIPSELHRLRAAGALDADQAAEYSDQYRRARRALKTLKGSRRARPRGRARQRQPRWPRTASSRARASPT